jgi:hypothetical protein
MSKIKAIFKYRGNHGYLQHWDSGREITCYVFESEELGVRDKNGVWQAAKPKWVVWIDPKHSAVKDLKPQVPGLEEEPDDIKYRYEIEFELKTDKDDNFDNTFITNADGTDKDKGITVIDKSAKTVLTEEQKEQRRQQEIADLKAGIQLIEWAIKNGDNSPETKNELAKAKAELAKLEKQQGNKGKDESQEREREREQNYQTEIWNTAPRANC